MFKPTIFKGDIITCYGARDIRELKQGGKYTAVTDEQEGIFAGRPYITVMDDEGKEYSCHSSRFKHPGNY